MAPGPGIEPGTHWREASALATGPPQLPLGHCHGYLPFGLWLLIPANLLGTIIQAHLFVMSLWSIYWAVYYCTAQ